MGFLVRLIVNAIALVIVAHVINGVQIVPFGGSWIFGALLAALILGVVNAILRPILVLISLPLEIITIGLFTLVINALLFWLVGSWHVGLYVADFWAGFWGAVLMAIVSWILSAVTGSFERSSR